MVVTGAGDGAGDKMNILIDISLSTRWKSSPVEAGVGAVHWSEVGGIGVADSVLASYTLADGLIVLTQDLGFCALLAASGDTAVSEQVVFTPAFVHWYKMNNFSPEQLNS